MQCFGHLREADAADVCEPVEELGQWDPRDRPPRMHQRGIRTDPVQCSLYLCAPFEDRRDLDGRDAGAASVRQPQVALVEGRRARVVAGVVVRVRLDEAGCEPKRIVNLDAASKNDSADRGASSLV
jgi:hypothetical protein